MSSIEQHDEKDECNSPTTTTSFSDEQLFTSMSASSREQMHEHGARFVQFVHSKNASVDLRTIDERAINEYLRFFYYTLQTKQGQQYSRSSLICIRSGIQRYFDLVLGRRLILPGNPTFMTSNRMLAQRARDSSNSGDAVRHYSPMLSHDRQLLNQYFDGDSPGGYSLEERLQDWVIFTIFYHFGCLPLQHQQKRRKQLQQQLLIRRDEILFFNDEKGLEYVTLPMQQNENGEREAGTSSTVRMYAGLDRLKTYISLLPPVTLQNSLFPKPLSGAYSSCANRGFNYLQSFMRNVSRKACISHFYSNQSIRLTRILDLHSSGFSASEIRSITGHKCDKSVKYCLKRTAAKFELQSASFIASIADSASVDVDSAVFAESLDEGAEHEEDYYEQVQASFVVMDYQGGTESAE